MYPKRAAHAAILGLVIAASATIGLRTPALGAGANGDGSTMPMDQPATPGMQQGGMGQGRMGPGGMGQGGMGRGRMGADDSPMMGMMRRMHAMMAGHAAGCAGGMLRLDHIEGRIAYMKAELSITPQQLPAWDALAEALRHAAARAAEIAPANAGAAAGPAPMGAAWPQRMAAAEHMLSARLAMVQALAGPVRDLYAVLSPAQRTVADQMTGAGPGGV